MREAQPPPPAAVPLPAAVPPSAAVPPLVVIPPPAVVPSPVVIPPPVRAPPPVGVPPRATAPPSGAIPFSQSNPSTLSNDASFILNYLRTHLPSPSPSLPSILPGDLNSTSTPEVPSDQLVRRRRSPSPTPLLLASPLHVSLPSLTTSSDEEAQPSDEAEGDTSGTQATSKPHYKVTGFHKAYHDFQEHFRVLGHAASTERQAITIASSQNKIKIGGITRKLASLGNNAACGKLHISGIEAVTPQPSYPPKDIVPEDALKMLGIKITMGKSDTHESLPIAHYNGYTLSSDTCFYAFSRALVSFLPFMHSLPPRDIVPGDDEKYYASSCLDNLFNKTSGAWTSCIMGDQLMTAIQIVDLMCMILYYKEEINKQRRHPSENEIITAYNSGADLLSTEQKKALELKQREAQFYTFFKPLLNTPHTSENPTIFPTPSPISIPNPSPDSLRLLPPPLQYASPSTLDPALLQGNPLASVIPTDITEARARPFFSPAPQVFGKGGRERVPPRSPPYGKPSKRSSFALGPPPTYGKPK